MSTQSTFDGPHLDELLDRVRRELGPDATILEATKRRRGGIGGFFAKEWYEVTVEDAAPTAPPDTADALLSMAESVTDERQLTAAGHHAAPGPRLVRVDADGLIAAPTPTGEFAAALAAAHRSAALPSATPADITLADPPAASTSPVCVTAVEPDTPSHASSVEGTVSELVPAPATRRLRDLDLAEMLGHLDTVVPVRPLPEGNAVVVVVGELASARTAASRLAVRLGLGPDDVVVATRSDVADLSPWLVIDSATSAAARSRRWRDAEHPTVVAVDLTLGAEGASWAHDVVARLRADEVRLVAKAWQLADQLASKAHALGTVDGLELVEVEASAEPELFLELTMPVLSIDGRAATSELWAALLMERRNDDHR
ncbi:MAG: hypothetical protein ACXIVQ_00455 [Acidimicrobiales bacterium]